MKNLLWLAVGIGIGAAVAARVAGSGAGREFVRTVADSYQARSAELKGSR